MKSGSAERTKGLQTYGVALQFLDKGNRRPIWILVNKPYEAVHLAMFLVFASGGGWGESGWRMLLLPL